MCGCSIILILKVVVTFCPCICSTKIYTSIKRKRNGKWKIPHTVLETRALCFRSYKNRKLRVKLCWVGTRERKKRTFFVPFISFEGNFAFYLNVYCTEYFQNIDTFTYQKTLLHTLLLLVFKIAESLQYILKAQLIEENLQKILKTSTN